ncbi:hypothetical protein FGO68_gene16791 [Halteria grandinella]|uniref:Uncharacterized protein n=1 Tax=Halteria grandinella TaxID=5974 RepID=A0A8J8NWA7_HALGN|nr:hypothetical protein FGO68_gene16791 [Halteria grandinella]
MSEVYKMFNYAGVKIPEHEIETLFHRASLMSKENRFKSMNNHIGELNWDLQGDNASGDKFKLKQKHRRISKGAPIKFEDFKAVMLSDVANHRFKLLIKSIRKQISLGIFDNVKIDIMYLPMDLNMMLSHLFQMAFHSHLNAKIIASILEEQETSLNDLMKAQAAEEDIQAEEQRKQTIQQKRRFMKVDTLKEPEESKISRNLTMKRTRTLLSGGNLDIQLSSRSGSLSPG